MRQKTFHREKRVVLSVRDELAYSRVLRENFPGAMFPMYLFSSE
jgi:hypothetical protein